MTAFADALHRWQIRLVTGGTDNHLVLMDTSSSFGLTGRQAEAALLEAGVVTNRNAKPNDGNGPWYTSGIRMGTPALTSLRFGPDEFEEIADIIATTLQAASSAPPHPARCRELTTAWTPRRLRRPGHEPRISSRATRSTRRSTSTLASR